MKTHLNVGTMLLLTLISVMTVVHAEPTQPPEGVDDSEPARKSPEDTSIRSPNVTAPILGSHDNENSTKPLKGNSPKPENNTSPVLPEVTTTSPSGTARTKEAPEGTSSNSFTHTTSRLQNGATDPAPPQRNVTPKPSHIHSETTQPPKGDDGSESTRKSSQEEHGASGSNTAAQPSNVPLPAPGPHEIGTSTKPHEVNPPKPENNTSTVLPTVTSTSSSGTTTIKESTEVTSSNTTPRPENAATDPTLLSSDSTEPTLESVNPEPSHSERAWRAPATGLLLVLALLTSALS